MSTDNMATFCFYNHRHNLVLNRSDLYDRSTHAGAIRAACAYAGSITTDTRGVVLRLQSEKDPDEAGIKFMAHDLFYYVRRCVEDGRFSPDMGSVGVLSVASWERDTAFYPSKSTATEYCMNWSGSPVVYLVRKLFLLWTEEMMEQAVILFEEAISTHGLREKFEETRPRVGGIIKTKEFLIMLVAVTTVRPSASVTV